MFKLFVQHSLVPKILPKIVDTYTLTLIAQLAVVMLGASIRSQGHVEATSTRQSQHSTMGQHSWGGKCCKYAEKLLLDFFTLGKLDITHLILLRQRETTEQSPLTSIEVYTCYVWKRKKPFLVTEGAVWRLSIGWGWKLWRAKNRVLWSPKERSLPDLWIPLLIKASWGYRYIGRY